MNGQTAGEATDRQICRVCKRSHGFAMQHTPLEYADADREALQAQVQALEAEREALKGQVGHANILAKYVWSETGEFGMPDGDCYTVNKGPSYESLQADLTRLRAEIQQAKKNCRCATNWWDGKDLLEPSELTTLRALVGALPIVRGALEINQQQMDMATIWTYSVDGKLYGDEALFDSSEQAQAYIDLLKYRATHEPARAGGGEE